MVEYCSRIHSHFSKINFVFKYAHGFSQPTHHIRHATGKLKTFQLVEGSMLLTIVPISYLLLKFCNVPQKLFLLFTLALRFVHNLQEWKLFFPWLTWKFTITLKMFYFLSQKCLSYLLLFHSLYIFVCPIIGILSLWCVSHRHFQY